MLDVEDACCRLSLALAFLCRSPGPGLALRQIKDAGSPPSCVHCEQRSATGLLDVVTMRGDSKNVEHSHY